MRRSPPRRPGSISAQTRLASLASLALTLLLGAACTGARANSHYRYPRDVAYGTPSTCPNVRMPPLRDGNVSTDAARCSYADANGARVTHLAGKVLAEGGPGDPGTGVNSVAVTVHSVAGPVFDPAAPGPVIAHATTDAQGNYSLRGVFVAGDYAVVVREPTGERIADRIVRVEPEAIGSLKNLHVTVPLDPRLKAAAVPPPTPPLDPRLHHRCASHRHPGPAAPPPDPAQAPRARPASRPPTRSCACARPQPRPRPRPRP